MPGERTRLRPAHGRVARSRRTGEPLAMTPRTAEIERITKESNIQVRLALDSIGKIQIASGIGFLDHLLNSLAFHAGFGLELTCRGDLNVDDHHTAEDCALAIGSALDQALGERAGIARFGWAYAPLD